MREIDFIQSNVSSQSVFLSSTHGTQLSVRQTNKYNSSNFTCKKIDTIRKLIDICIEKTNLIDEKNITVSSSHIVETYKLLNVYFDTLLSEINLNIIAVFVDDETLEIFENYFSLYKKFNNIKIEYYLNDENFIMVYDNKPLNIFVEDINEFLTPTMPFALLYGVNYKWKKETHNGIKFNIVNDSQKFERKLKIENLNEKN